MSLTLVITTILTYFLETIGTFLIACRTIEYKIKNIFKFLFYILLLTSILSASELMINNSNLLYMIQAIIYIVLLSIYSKQPFPNALLVYVYVYIVIGVLQYLMFLPILAVPKLDTLSYYPVIALFITTMLCYAIYCFVPIERLYRITMLSDLVIRVLLVNFYLVLMFGSMYYKFHNKSFREILPLFLLYLCTFIAINMNAVFTRITLSKKEAELHAYQQYQPIVDNLIQNIRMRQHNFDNAIQSFAALPLTCKDYESITSALNEYSTEAFHSNIDINLLKLNERLVAGLLYTKLQDAQKQNKILYISIKNYALQTTLPEYLLMECIGILIDNAIEAVPQDSVISLQLGSENGQVIVEVKNPGPCLSDQLLKKIFEMGYTTKNDTQKKHGLGLPFLKKIIRQYHGTISCQNISDGTENYIVFKLIV